MAAGALAMCAPSPTTGEEPALGTIDTHQHLWDLSKFRLPWLERPGEKLRRDYLPADYGRDAMGLNVVRAIYMEVEVAPEQHDAEAEYVIDLCRRKEGVTVAGVIGGRPEDPGFEPYISKYKGSAVVKGVRSVFPKGGADNEQFLKSLRLLGTLGMSYDLLMDSSQLAEGAKVADAFPGTRFILDHCGNATTRFFGPAPDAELTRRRKAWESGIAQLAQHKNVVCKISGVAESGPPELATVEAMSPIINTCLDAFGEDRVLFASNWPVCLKTVTFGRWVELLNQIVNNGRSLTARRKLFSDNAAAFYGIAT